jgi:hypothetical protein
MPRRRAKITQADISRVLRAVAQSGMKMRVEISQDGKISVEPVDTTSGKVDSGKVWVP